MPPTRLLPPGGRPWGGGGGEEGGAEPADTPCVLLVATVGLPPGLLATLGQASLRPVTDEVVQPDGGREVDGGTAPEGRSAPRRHPWLPSSFTHRPTLSNKHSDPH